MRLDDLAGRLGCPFEGDGTIEIRGVAGLEAATEGDLVFLAHPKLRPLLEKSRASAAVVAPDEPRGRLSVIRSKNPQLAFIRAVELFFQPYRPAAGVHPLASVAPTARLGRDVSVGALSVIGEEAEIGDGTVIFPLVSVYPRVRIGRGCVLHSHVSLREDVQLGDRVVLHNGVVIGSDGYGYLQGEDGRHIKIPQKGRVILEDDVEIGANTAVDRAALESTTIRRGTKIDNLVQVAHNVEIGEDALVMAQVGIAGSSKIGRGAILCGQAGIPDHVTIGEGAVVLAKSGVTKDVPSKAMVSGSPHLDVRDWRKVWVLLPQLYDLMKDFKRLKARVEELEESLKGSSGKKP